MKPRNEFSLSRFVLKTIVALIMLTSIPLLYSCTLWVRSPRPQRAFIIVNPDEHQNKREHRYYKKNHDNGNRDHQNNDNHNKHGRKH